MYGALGSASLLFLIPPLAPQKGGWRLFAQGFGENQVIRKDFDWKVASTEHFDIHYYDGSAAVVPWAAEFLEGAYARQSKALDTTYRERRPFFLYGSINDFQQSNIAAVGDGTGGVTEAFKNRFMVYNDGSRWWLDAVITHEHAHIMEFNILMEGFWKTARILKSFLYPLWLMEGIAEHSTGHTDEPHENMYLRDAATSGGLLSLVKMHHFGHLKPHQVTLAYKQGAEAMEFIEGEFGKDKVGKMLKLFESRFEVSSVLGDLLGLDIFGFDRKFREYTETKYAREVRLGGLKEPSAYGKPLTVQEDTIPQFNISPVFAPDGSGMAFLSTREGYPAGVYWKDLQTGKVRRLVARRYLAVENIPMGNFALLSRNLAISPDGRTLIFVGQKNHAERFYFYDLKRGKLSWVEPEGFMTLNQPSFSPDGRKVAFSGMKGGLTDLYLMDLRTKALDRLTQDDLDDQSPSFSPDGSKIVYSSEVEVPGSPHPHQRRLFELDLASREVTRLLDEEGSARDPVYSPDGSRVLYINDTEGIIEVYELERASRKVVRLTRTIGGNFTPTYIPHPTLSPPGGEDKGEGERIAFASFRKGSVHIYHGDRSSFEKPPVLEATLPPAPGPGPHEHPAEPAPAPGKPSEPEAPLYALSPERPYRFSASTDLFFPAFFYSTQGGFFWTSYWQGSDLLGNHTGQAFINYNSGQSFLNYQAQYVYGRFRPQLIFGAGGGTSSDNLDGDLGLYKQQVHAQYAGVRYPFDRYHRLELFLASKHDDRTFTDTQEERLGHERLTEAALVRDTVNGRYLVATRGSRLRLAYTRAHPVLGGVKSYDSTRLEAHKYFETGRQSALALRTSLGLSQGPDRLSYGAGGIAGLRGYGTFESSVSGSRFALATAEWRFPLFKDLNYYMWYIFPDFYFKAIFADVFTDVGYVWDTQAQLEGLKIPGLRNSVGLGVSLHTFILQTFPFVLRFEWAQTTTEGGGIFYVYLGPTF